MTLTKTCKVCLQPHFIVGECPNCSEPKFPTRQVDFDWADKQLPAGITRQDICIWTQDSDGPWNASCGVTWEFTDGGPADNGAHFCHHCGGVLLADPFADDHAQPNTKLNGGEAVRSDGS